jgi:UDP-2,3-diacylglucosamine pyrophosphatase LpxH
MHAKWMAHLRDAGYTLLLQLNRPLNLVRRLFGFGYWSFSAYMKQSVKKVVNVISRFEEAVAHYAELHRVDGIVCGHIHTPAVRQIRGVKYYNTGDWVESSTALVEHFDGRLELMYWREESAGNAIALDATTSDLADKSGLLTATH